VSRCGLVDITVDGGAPHKSKLDGEVSGVDFQYPAFRTLLLEIDHKNAKFTDDCQVELICTTIYTRLMGMETLTFSNPSNPVWALQLPVGVLLVLAAGALTRSVYVRVMTGGVSGVLAMFFIVAVITYRLAPGSVRNVGKTLWFVGAIGFNAFLYTFKPIGDFMKNLFLDNKQPFPHMTLAGWVLAVFLVFAFVSGATLVKRYTEDVNVQHGLAWLVRILGFAIIVSGIQNDYLGISIVILLLVPFVLPKYLWAPFYAVLFSPLILCWWGFRFAIKSAFGWEVQNADEIFYTGAPIPDYAPPSPAPLQRSRPYLTREQAERQSEATTQQHVDQMKLNVAAGHVQVPEWRVINGRFVQTGSNQRDDVHNLTPVAQRRLQRAIDPDL